MTSGSPPERKAVVVGLDLVTRGYVTALAFGAEEAARRNTTLRLVHGCTPASMAPLLNAVSSRAQRRKWAGRELEVMAGRVPHLTPVQVEVQTCVYEATGPEALQAESQRAALLVLERRRVGPLTHWAFGSTSSTVLSTAGCPVALLAANVGNARTGAGIVVGVVDDEHVQQVLDFVVEEARLRAATVTAVHVLDGAEGLKRWPSERHLLKRRFTVEEVRSRLLHVMAPHQNAHPDVSVCLEVVDEPVVAGLRRAAGEALLLVLGRSRRSASWDQGWVTRECLGSVACPVVVVGPGVPRV